MASTSAADTMPDALRQSRYHMKRCFARYIYYICIYMCVCVCVSCVFFVLVLLESVTYLVVFLPVFRRNIEGLLEREEG